MPTVGRKKIYANPQERRKNVPSMYVRKDTRAMLKAQAKRAKMTQLDYLDQLAETHENPDTNYFKVTTKSGHVIMISSEVMLAVFNNDIDDVLLKTLVNKARAVTQPQTVKE